MSNAELIPSTQELQEHSGSLLTPQQREIKRLNCPLCTQNAACHDLQLPRGRQQWNMEMLYVTYVSTLSVSLAS